MNTNLAKLKPPIKNEEKPQKREKIIKALNAAGLTDTRLAKDIETNVKAGTGIKATADTSLRGIELAARLKGYLDTKPETLIQTNVYIEELKGLSTEELGERLEKLEKEIAELKLA